MRLAATLARAAGEDLVLATVVPTHWPPGVGRIDAEYQAYLDGVAAAALDRARGRAAAGRPGDRAGGARAVRPPGRAARGGAATRRRLLVIGSSAVGRARAGCALGSVGEHLLHACAGAGRAGAARLPVRRGHGRLAGDGGLRGRRRGRPIWWSPRPGSRCGSVRSCGWRRSPSGPRRRARSRWGRTSRTRSSASGWRTSRRNSAGCSSWWRDCRWPLGRTPR